MADLIRQARDDGSPVIDGATATFVWEGDRPAQLIGDLTRWSPVEAPSTGLQFQPAGPRLWTLTVAPELDAYLEYALIADGRRVLDPLNPRRAPNGFGDTNHYFHMPGAPRSDLFRRRRGVPRGQVEYLGRGTYDFLYQGVRAMHRLLQERGYQTTYNEFHAGHNYPAWREDLAGGLRWLFGGGEDARSGRRNGGG